MVVLLIVLVAAAMTSGWIAVMNAQLQYAAQYVEVSKREIAFANASAIAREYFLTQALTKSSAPGVTIDLGNGWGGVEIPATGSTPLSTFQKRAGYNHFAPGNGDGYSESVTVLLKAGAVEQSGTFFLNSRSAALGGAPLVLNSPASGISGTISVVGLSTLWQAGGTYSLRSTTFALRAQPAANLIGIGGASVPPTNFPFVPMTGSEVGGVPSYSGALNVINNTSGINSLRLMAVTSAPNGLSVVDGSIDFQSNGVDCDGAGVVELNLANPALGNVLITGNVTTLRFLGQTSEADRTIAGNAAAIIVVVHQTLPATDLAAVELTQSNHRKLALAVKSVSGNPMPILFPAGGTGSWRLLLTLESTPLSIQITGGAQSILGGIQSDRNISVVSGAVNILQEPDPKLMERLAARNGWVEAFVQ